MRVLALLLVIVLLPGCESDPVTPATDAPSPQAWFDGQFDGEDFVLKRIDQVGPDGNSINLDLIVTGSDFDSATNRLTVTVHIRNRSDFYLRAPATVGLSGFDPETVHPVNAIEYEDDQDRWWYDYGNSLGEDWLLAPGELSGGLDWVLQLQSRASFSFDAMARFQQFNTDGLLAGRVFVDLNRNGARDLEEPAGSGRIEVTRAGSTAPHVIDVAGHGSWTMPITSAGLYSIRWLPSPTEGESQEVCTTTVNPRQVMILMENSLVVGSYTTADVGIDPEPCTELSPYVTLIKSRGPVADLESDPWEFLGVRQRARDGELPRLEFDLTIRACTSTNYISLFFEEASEDDIAASRMRATFVHTDFDGSCDTDIHTTRYVTIYTLRRHWEAMTGVEGPAVLELVTPGGPELIELK